MAAADIPSQAAMQVHSTDFHKPQVLYQGHVQPTHASIGQEMLQRL